MKPLFFLISLPALLLATGAPVSAAEQLPLWQAMERASQSNPAIRSQQIELDRQSLEQEIARAQHLPKVDLNAGYSRYAYPTLVTPIRQAGVFPPMDKDITSIGLAMSLPLYSGGKLVAGEALAAHNREAAAQALRASGQDLLFNVVATYTKALHFRQLDHVLESRIKSLQQEEKNIAQRIEQGRAARLELIRLQTQLSQARHDRLAVRQAEKDALSLLTSMLGESGSPPVLAELGPTSPALPASIEEAMNKARQQRPGILKLQAMGKAAQEKTAIARGDQLPQVNLVAKAQETAGGNTGGYDDWQLGIQLTFPVFDGAIRKNRVEQATMEQRQNQMLLEDARNRLSAEVEQAFGGLTEARSRLEVAAQGEIEAREALRIETLRYHGGESTITDLLSAESVLWASTANHLQAGYDITVSQARLLRATGELAPDTFKPDAPITKETSPIPTSSGEKLAMAQYLSWHQGIETCRSDTPRAITRIKDVNHSEHAIKQGARL